MVFFTSVLIWLLETVKYWFVMHAFSFSVSFFALMLMNGVVNLATTIPSAPGYLGTFDLPGIAVLQAYNIPREVAASYTFVLHFALWFPVTALGLYYMFREGIKWTETIQAKDEPAPQEGIQSIMKRIAILGAGFGGLSTAYDLIRKGNQVTIYEASSNVGGLSAGFKESHWDWSVEQYYHHWFASDRHMLGLINELGWSDQVLFPRPYTVMYYNGSFYPFNSILKAILFPGLGWGINKVRFGLVGLFLRLTNDWKVPRKIHRGCLDA